MLIAQISDTHVTVGGPQGRNLAAALDAIAASRPRPDVVVLTGDAANRGLRAEYAVLREVLDRSPIPVYIVPGNHDCRAILRRELPERYFPGVRGERLHFAVEDRPVRLIGVDTTAPRRPGAILAAADLAWLDATLAARPEQTTFVFMHHPPFRTGVTLADLLGFAGLTALRALVARHRTVQLVAAGHIHCVRSAPLAHARAATTFSTSPQQVPELFERRVVGLRPEPAGFALHAWTDGAFVTTHYAAQRDETFSARQGGAVRV